MIQKLSFALPFFTSMYVEEEKNLRIPGCCLVLNVDERGKRPIQINKIPLYPLRSAIVWGAEMEIPGRAFIITNFGSYSVCDEGNASQVKSVWKSLWDYSHLERNRNIPYYKSERAFVGGHIGMNFCLAEAGAPSSIHRAHETDFDEVHLQVCGSGKIQLFSANDPATIYQEFPLTEGQVNDRIWDEKGNYPWHRYQSMTRSVFVVVEIDR